VTSWQDRYLLLRGVTSERPCAHRWAPGPPYSHKRTACGLLSSNDSQRLVMVLDSNLSPDLPRCRRCWPR
jgi:hypothetical protein